MLAYLPNRIRYGWPYSMAGTSSKIGRCSLCGQCKRDVKPCLHGCYCTRCYATLPASRSKQIHLDTMNMNASWASACVSMLIFNTQQSNQHIAACKVDASATQIFSEFHHAKQAGSGCLTAAHELFVRRNQPGSAKPCREKAWATL